MATTTVGIRPVMSPVRRDGVTAALGAWLMVGLLLDGYMHNTIGDQLESFLTPWHGVLYAGFLASAAWIAAPMRGARGTVRDRLGALPEGYLAGAVGALVFGMGGLADAVWHSLYGIEVDLEALVSPPHLVLLAGAMLVLTTPARAAWRRRVSNPSFSEFLPALTSVTLAVLLVGFFFMYASGLFDFHATARFREFFAPGGRMADQQFLHEVLSGFGLVARLWTTVVLMAAVLLVLRRWTPPNGSFTVLFTTYGAFMLVLADFRHPEMIVAAFAAGLTTDVLVARLQPTPERPGAVRIVAAAVPTVLWTTHFTLLAATGDLGWSANFWGGTVLFAAGTGYALSLLVVPPPIATDAPQGAA